MNNTIIGWTRLTWNPWSGCEKVSPGCKRCYALTIAENKRGTKAFPNGFDLTYRWHKLLEPLKIKEPSLIFVNSMSDLYLGQRSGRIHDREVVPFEAIDRVYASMALAPWHTYQILTKRSARQLEYLSDPETPGRIMRAMTELRGTLSKNVIAQVRQNNEIEWPLRCVWNGVSIENADYLWRLDDLRKAPAFVRFVSFEPLLGLIKDPDLTGIGWAIVGGESGPGYRPMEMSWARALRDACVAQGTAYFLKQDSGYRTELHPWLVEEDGSRWKWHQFPGAMTSPERLKIAE